MQIIKTEFIKDYYGMYNNQTQEIFGQLFHSFLQSEDHFTVLI